MKIRSLCPTGCIHYHLLIQPIHYDNNSKIKTFKVRSHTQIKWIIMFSNKTEKPIWCFATIWNAIWSRLLLLRRRLLSSRMTSTTIEMVPDVWTHIRFDGYTLLHNMALCWHLRFNWNCRNEIDFGHMCCETRAYFHFHTQWMFVYAFFLGHFYCMHCTTAELCTKQTRGNLLFYFWWIKSRADAQSKFNSKLNFPFVIRNARESSRWYCARWSRCVCVHGHICGTERMNDEHRQK